MKSMKNLSSIIICFCFVFLVSFSDNLYEQYKTAEGYYNKKDYSRAIATTEKVLAAYPEYGKAKLLYFKILLANGDKVKAQELFLNIIKKENDEIKIELFNYLSSNNEFELTENAYNSVTNKDDIDKQYIEFLYKNKKYKKIAELNSRYKDEYLEKIENSRTKADKFYFAALSDLKKNNVANAVNNLKKAIEIYPENQTYYIKLGEIYADNKNFFLAEKNFKIALTYSEDKKIYEKLFAVYLETKNYEKLHETSKYISDISYVRDIMKKLDEELSSKKKIMVLKREGQRLYVEKAFLKGNQIGDTFSLLKEKEPMINEKTGESFGGLKENYAQVRLYDSLNELSILVILEEYKTINEKDEFFLY